MLINIVLWQLNKTYRNLVTAQVYYCFIGKIEGYHINDDRRVAGLIEVSWLSEESETVKRKFVLQI